MSEFNGEQPWIVLDAMGGDNAPYAVVKGVVESLAEINGFGFILVGDESIVVSELSKYKYNTERIKVVHAQTVITNEDSPANAVKEKKDSSMVVGLNLLKSNQGQAFISAGNTGALLVASTFIVGRIPGVERPALAVLLPTADKPVILLDCGANVDAKPSALAQFAVLGSLYSQNILQTAKPRVGLINIGAEESKGNAQTKESYSLLKNNGINFIGNVEARDIPFSVADVLVCDAFVGNIVLKYTEGFAKALMSMIKTELSSSFVSKLGALLSMKSFKKLKKRMDYNDVGGAPLIGLKNLVVKAHGSSDSNAIKGAIRQSVTFIESGITAKMTNEFSQADK